MRGSDGESAERSVLLVVADDAIRDALAMLLRSLGCGVWAVASPDAALPATSPAPRLIVVDQTHAAAGEGARLAGLLGAPRWADVPVVLLGAPPHGVNVEPVRVRVFPMPVHLAGVIDEVVRRCERRARPSPTLAAAATA